jgi:hypothetical protein
MNARGARHLRDAGDGHFHIGGRDEHQVGQLVNDDDDVGLSFSGMTMSSSRGTTICSSTSTANRPRPARLFPFWRSGSSGSCGGNGLSLGVR